MDMKFKTILNEMSYDPAIQEFVKDIEGFKTLYEDEIDIEYVKILTFWSKFRHDVNDNTYYILLDVSVHPKPDFNISQFNDPDMIDKIMKIYLNHIKKINPESYNVLVSLNYKIQIWGFSVLSDDIIVNFRNILDTDIFNEIRRMRGIGDMYDDTDNYKNIVIDWSSIVGDNFESELQRMTKRLNDIFRSHKKGTYKLVVNKSTGEIIGPPEEGITGDKFIKNGVRYVLQKFHYTLPDYASLRIFMEKDNYNNLKPSIFFSDKNINLIDLPRPELENEVRKYVSKLVTKKFESHGVSASLS